MPLWLKIAHWALNVLLWLGALTCFILAVFGQGPDVTVLNRVFTVVAGIALGYISYRFTIYTLDKG